MYRVFDSHAHIYPAAIAQKASRAIGDFYDIPMRFDGTVESLLKMGDECGVDKFLVHSVATNAHQVVRINDFILSECEKHAGRLIGFATMHPDFEAPADELARVKALGLSGVKLHPDFQKFSISDAVMDDAYAAMAELKLPVLIHTGDKRYTWSHPRHIPIIKAKHPKLRVICAHFGAYSQWEDAVECLHGEDVWVDTSSSLFALSKETARGYINAYGSERVLFGSDYPMWSAGDEIERMLSLNLTDAEYENIFSNNLENLLNMQ